MTKHDLGVKHLCTNCGAKFYDLTRTPPTCPKCETIAEPVERPRTTRSSKPRPKPAKVAPVAEEEPKVAAEESNDAEDDDEEGEAVIEDVTELGEDESDLAGVVQADDETT